MIRHKQRHIHRTLVEEVTTALTAGGWVNQPTIFGAISATILDTMPDERGQDVNPNTVAVSMGDEGPQDDEELGAEQGGLVSVTIPVYVDVYGENQTISIALASDVKDALYARRVLALRDWSQPGAPAVEGTYIALEDIAGPERPQAASGIAGFKRHWRVVKALATTYYKTD